MKEKQEDDLTYWEKETQDEIWREIPLIKEATQKAYLTKDAIIKAQIRMESASRTLADKRWMKNNPVSNSEERDAQYLRIAQWEYDLCKERFEKAKIEANKAETELLSAKIDLLP